MAYYNKPIILTRDFIFALYPDNKASGTFELRRLLMTVVLLPDTSWADKLEPGLNG